MTCGDHGGFTCKNGFCIDVEGVCDGNFDCPDQSDEVNCGKYINNAVHVLSN